MSDLAGHLWAIVLTRDREADGLFVYAVSSTGVFCRPSCPSRRPARARVEFFPSAGMAVAHGYRACRRCRPRRRDWPPAELAMCSGPVRPSRWRPNVRGLSRACRRLPAPSAPQLQRAFRRVLGMTPRDYVAACRRRSLLVPVAHEPAGDGRRV